MLHMPEGVEVLVGSVAMFLAAGVTWLIMDAIVGIWYDRNHRRKFQGSDQLPTHTNEGEHER